MNSCHDISTNYSISYFEEHHKVHVSGCHHLVQNSDVFQYFSLIRQKLLFGLAAVKGE